MGRKVHVPSPSALRCRRRNPAKDAYELSDKSLANASPITDPGGVSVFGIANPAALNCYGGGRLKSDCQLISTTGGLIGKDFTLFFKILRGRSS